MVVSKDELVAYYDSRNSQREVEWKKELGDDLNWSLSFDNLTEAETTKHVHRLHPYKGKLIHCVPYLKDDFDIFIVANDKFNLYPTIADLAGLCIVNQYKRPVINRTERDKGAYCEM